MDKAASLPERARPRAVSPLTIRAYMTEAPHSIGFDQSLATAHQMMRSEKIRHLPVLRAGELVGMVSQRDLYLLETLRDVDPRTATVEEAMTSHVFRVSPDATLEEVVSTMSKHRYGSAVVMEDEDVVGIFTTVDALDALAAILRAPPKRRRMKLTGRRAAR